MNISSIVVLTKAEDMQLVIDEIKKLSFCDYFFDDGNGRIVITIEGENIEDEMNKLRVVESIYGVILAQMQMSYSEDELDALQSDVQKSSSVPTILNADVDAKAIVYNGDLKGKM